MVRTTRTTSIRLSDGRELTYYDETPDADRSARDVRGLERVGTGSELRWDRLAGEWVVVASHRQGRTFLPASDACPLCPSRPGHPTEVPAQDYDVVVFENRFPSLTDDAELGPDVPGAVERRPGVGRCEVVCFSPDHDASFASLPPSRVRTIVDAWADRTEVISRIPGIEHVFPFENRGREIGVTLNHPHGQIYGYPFVAPMWRRTLEIAAAHRADTGRNLFADVLADERSAGVRVVAENEHWTAFVPAAARWPVEVHLFPRRQVPDLPALSDDERDAFAALYLEVLGRLDRFFDVPLPYMAAWYQAPVHALRDEAYLHLRVLSIRRAPDKLKYLAGSESAMGVFVADTVPEAVAARLRSLGAPDAQPPT